MTIKLERNNQRQMYFQSFYCCTVKLMLLLTYYTVEVHIVESLLSGQCGTNNLISTLFSAEQ